MQLSEIKHFLDQKAEQYNAPSFILDDPIQIPHRFKKKEDIEIAGFLASIIAWGQRRTIIRNCDRLMDWMDDSPHEFLCNLSSSDLEIFSPFVHRTFNSVDCKYFIQRLSTIYKEHDGLEGTLGKYVKESGVEKGLHEFKNFFFNVAHEKRSTKHLANPIKGSSAKRLNMFLRWMVRKDEAGVDFGIWKDIPASSLSLPLDVHTGNVARSLGILKRKQNDWKAVQELDTVLRAFDPVDPVRYDFALFGIGAYEDWEIS